MKRMQNWWILGATTIAILLILALLFPPRNIQESGSTFGRAPNGYGAWYAYMQGKGIQPQRWQRNESDFLARHAQNTHTFLRVFPILSSDGFSQEMEAWIKKGNHLVLIGVNAPATYAPFFSQIPTDRGNVTIETTRRMNTQFVSQEVRQGQAKLKDKSGAIVWQYALEKGKVTLVYTPHLAANAYQDSVGNFAFLADLVDEGKFPIVIDEYLHGYIEKEALKSERKQKNWLDYFLKTPLLILTIQGILIVIVLIWEKNRRFGKPLEISSPALNNSSIYLDALGEVLLKSESHSFVVEKISKAEQQYLQNKLGLGNTPLAIDALVAAWKSHTGRSGAEIIDVFPRHPSISSTERLLDWLKKVARLRDQVSPEGQSKGKQPN